MVSLSSLLLLAHVVGIALGVGAATVKLALLLKSMTDHAFVQIHVQIARLITRHIIVGMVLLTLSGIGFLLLGYPLTPKLVVKLALFAGLWVMGPVIDNVVEPKFHKLALESGAEASAEFIRIRKHYLALEISATLLFYLIIAMWMLF